MKKHISAALAALLLLISCGCQKTPEKSVVTSKNDGAFEAALDAAPQAAPAAGAESAVYADSFENANGGIRYELSLTAPELPPALPVVRARPMEITPELAQKTAQAVFGDAQIYEYTTEHTKAELEAAILEMKESISDWDALVEDCGGDEAVAESYKAMREESIAAMEEAYAAAPDAVDRSPCDWQFHPSTYYEDVTHLGHISDIGYQVCKAGATLDGVPFVFEASNLEKDDFREHSITIGADSELTDTDALWADTGQRPDLSAVQERAVQIAGAMGLGVWRVAECESDLNAASVTYLTLTREYEGLPMTFHDDPSEAETAYGPSYTYEKLRMDFNGDKLLSLLYQGALAETGVVNENVQILPFADILAAAKTQMQLRGTLNPVTGETIPASEDGSYSDIAVDRVELGLSRIFIKDNTAEYYLVPTYTFYGTSTACSADGSPIDYSFFDEASGRTVAFPNPTTVELAVINAVDGSVIDTGLGY